MADGGSKGKGFTVMKRVWMVIVMAVLAGVIGWRAARPSEPVYKGKKLTSWIQGYCDWYGTPYPEAEEAVNQIGTNAIPTLLRLLRANDSALKLKVIGLMQRQYVVKIEYTPAIRCNYHAASAFAQLGTNAQSAVPELIEIAKENISFSSQAAAIRSLGAIGPAAKEAVPLLLEWATNADPPMCFYVNASLRKIDPKAATKAGIGNVP